MNWKPLFISAVAVLLPASLSHAAPNVLFIALDDLRPELGCYGKEQIISPNIDRLAARGMVFERAYCQVAVCGASRASLLSGLRPESTGCWTYNTPLRSQRPEVITLPQHFRDNGYATGMLGKIYHSAGDDAASWSVNMDALAPRRAGNGRSYVATPDEAFVPHARQEGRRMGPATENGGDAADEAYVDGENARRAVVAMEALAAAGDPFFLAVGFIKPHLPFNAPGEYWDLYDPAMIPIPPREDVIASVPYGRSDWGELKAYSDIPGDADTLDDAISRRLIHGYYAATSFADAQVGKLLDAVGRLGIADSTIIVLWGDHGWYLGDFGDWCKHTNYEVATHVPLVIAGPGVTPGRTRALTEFVDIFPTLAELAGLERPGHLQGTSFVPLLSHPEHHWKEAAFSQYIRNKPGVGAMLGTSVRTDRYRYTEWRNRRTGALDAKELIDFATDPGAARNVAGDPGYAEALVGLAELAGKSGAGVTPR